MSKTTARNANETGESEEKRAEEPHKSERAMRKTRRMI